MNEDRKQTPQEWKVVSMREAATEFIFELWNHAPLDGSGVPSWVLDRMRELNRAAGISTNGIPAPVPDGKGESTGSSSPAAAAVVLPYPAPDPGQLPPAAVRSRSHPRRGQVTAQAGREARSRANHTHSAKQHPGDLQGGQPARMGKAAGQ